MTIKAAMCWTNLRLKKKLKNMKSEVKYIDADTVTSLLLLGNNTYNMPQQTNANTDIKLAIFYQ